MDDQSATSVAALDFPILYCSAKAGRASLERPEDGGFPEFNSLTITTLVTEIEEVVDCEIADEELSGEIFATVGSLADFVHLKMAHAGAAP